MHRELDVTHLRTLNAVLQLAARRTNLLQSQTFDELCTIVRTVMPFAVCGVSLADGPRYSRVHALSPSHASLGQGMRVALDQHPSFSVVYLEERIFRCDDTRESDHPLDVFSVENGLLSSLSIPVPNDVAGGPVVGCFYFLFRTVHGGAEAPIPLLQEIADVIAANLARALPLARERRLAMILTTSGDGMIAWDRDGLVTDANDAAASLTGLSRQELIGFAIRDLFDPIPDVSQPNEARQGVRLGLYARDAAGARRTIVAATITPVDDDPQVAAHALLRDLSKVAAAEREAALHLARIRELEEQHRTLLDNAPLIIFRLDPETAELVFLNRHAERLLGVPTAEAMCTPGFLRLAHADIEGVENFDAAIARARAGVLAQPYEARMRHQGLGEITVRGTVYPLLSEGGELVAIEGVLADVSAERAARTKLVQADRLATLGTLSAGVAHEINNPAAFILLGLDMLARQLTGPGVTMEAAAATSAHEMLGELRDSIKRIVDIARDLRLFASPPSREPGRTVVDVNRTVLSALTLTRGHIIDRAQIDQRLVEVPPVIMDDGRLGQVIVNLLVNAAQAIPRSYERDHRVSVSTRSDGQLVQIVVTDTGVGISPENLDRIWQPFFTTKGPDVGTGLGLSISREIVERAGGRIEAMSPAFPGDPPSGSSFTISLPAAGRGESITPISSPLPRIPSQRARVLVVEDEASLARALADEIGRVHDVVIASGAEQARALLASNHFDAVLCDLRMPGMSGDAFYDEIASRDPAQAERFLFMTGVGFGAEVERFVAESGRPILEKPFAMDMALSAIAKVIIRAHRTLPAPRPSGSTR